MYSIKYRVWVNDLKKFVHPDDDIETQFFLSQQGKLFYKYCKEMPYNLSYSLPYTIQFFTGKQDINYKKIYEGDILECEESRYGSSGGEDGGTGWKTHSVSNFSVKYEAHLARWNIYTSEDPYITRDYKVVGNIFETPHLILDPLKL